MRRTCHSKSPSPLRVILLAAGLLALAGCATGYSFVQPDPGDAGSYYTGDGPYQAPAYYYGYGAGAYAPYGAGYGYGSFYGPSFTFGLGLGSVCGWMCGSYYGGWPWYYGGAGYYVRHHHGHRHRHGDPVVSNPSPRAWLRPDHPRVPPRDVARSSGTAPIAMPERPLEAAGNRRMLDSAAFAPRGDARMPRTAGIPDRPAYMAPQPPAFAERPMRMPAPHDFARPAARAPAPLRVAPPATRHNQAPSIKIR